MITAHIVMASVVMAYVVTAHIHMAHIGTAYVVAASILGAYIGTAYMYLWRSLLRVDYRHRSPAPIGNQLGIAAY